MSRRQTWHSRVFRLLPSIAHALNCQSSQKALGLSGLLLKKRGNSQCQNIFVMDVTGGQIAVSTSAPNARKFFAPHALRASPTAAIAKRARPGALAGSNVCPNNSDYAFPGIRAAAGRLASGVRAAGEAQTARHRAWAESVVCASSGVWPPGLALRQAPSGALIGRMPFGPGLICLRTHVIIEAGRKTAIQ